MSVIYHDDDADLAALAGQTVAVVGYGNQGRSQALNLRDSGLDVVIGNLRDAYARAGRAPTASRCCRSKRPARAPSVVMLLVPDEVMPEVYARARRAGAAPRATCVCFASGYNVAFGLIAPATALDVVLIAPRMIGVGVRDAFVSGRGFPSFVGVHRDATGTAKPRMLALCQGIGATRGGCIEMSMHDEATLDLFTEQGFGPAFGRVLMTAVDLLVEAGYPPEAVLVELYLSGELAYSLEKIREVGMLRQMDFHSHTSQYGSITRGARFLALDGAAARQDGRGARGDPLGRASPRSGRDSASRPSSSSRRSARRAIRCRSPSGRRRARAAFRIGDGLATPRAGARRRGGGASACVLFDGVCVFCNGAVRWLTARDPRARLRFAPLQGETAAALRARHPEIPEALETLVYVERDAAGERVLLRSAAALPRAGAARLAVASRWRGCALLPRALATAPTWPSRAAATGCSGSSRACPIPTPEASRALPALSAAQCNGPAAPSSSRH